MRIGTPAICACLLSGAAACAADADLDAAIARNRMGTLIIRTAPGAKVSVEQVRHEFWFGATLPGGIFTGRNSPEDIAKFKEVLKRVFRCAATAFSGASPTACRIG